MKYLFAFINMFLVAAMAYFCVEILYKKVIPQIDVTDGNFAESISKVRGPRQTKYRLHKNDRDIIVKRNLFKVEIEDKSEAPGNQEKGNQTPEKPEATNLKLVLWGTVTGGSVIYAVIEDQKIRQQALYQLGDLIQGAKIKKISRNEVILFYQGKDQVLEMATGTKNVLKPQTASSKIRPGRVPMKEGIAGDLMENLGALMRQIKFRPHFTEGEPDGLMVYGIRTNSVFRKIGLRNGDIIKDVNDTPIVSVDDALRLFTEMEEAQTAKITLSRRGKQEELFYEAKGDE